MEFRLLGPVEVLAEGQPVGLGGRQRRTVLAILLVHVGEAVSTDRLIDELWGKAPPAAGRKTVQAHVAHLRRILGDSGGGEAIHTAGGGYVLEADPEMIDSHRFERLLAEAGHLRATSPLDSVRTLEEALGLFRGEALADVADAAFSLRVEASRLEELRLTASEDRLEALIAGGRSQDVISEARRLLSRHRLRERMWAILMLALYRSGRQGEALEAFSLARQTLAEELGLEPSADLRLFEQRILEQDPELDGARLVSGGEPAGSAPAAQRPLPTGTVTFLFTDVEGSTRLWEQEPGEAGPVLAGHERLLRRLIGEGGGQVFKGTGDGVLAVFGSANHALAVAVQIQRTLQPDRTAMSTRVSLHSGEAEVRHNDYYGVALNICQRLLDSAHGGQIVLTLATEEVLAKPLPPDVVLLDLGRHHLRDLTEEVHVFQVGHPELRSEFPSLRTAETALHNLPPQLTGFVGRGQELAEVEKILRGARLVTLTGVGGGGKSRLALQSGRHLLDEFPGGVWLVELAPVAEPGLVPRLIAHALGIPEEPGRTLVESIAATVRDTPTLLLLDNCEHLIAACAETADELLHAAPEVRILATSRERLGVPGEAVYVVPPMTVPGEGEAATVEMALRYDAVRLFAQRAPLAQAGFRVTESNSEVVGRICRVVDGIPLAVELAAGKVATLTVDQIASRLDDRFEIPGGGGRVGMPRHQTMLAALDWSYDQLSAVEKSVLGQLSVFRGGFELGDAEVICAEGGVEDVLQPVMTLHEKSLLVRDASSGRYRLLEPVRRYASEKRLVADRPDTVSQRHAAMFAEMAERGSKALQGKEGGVWLDRFEQEHDNLRAALRWALDNGAGDLALRIAGGAWRFWKVRGHITEGRGWLERALEGAPDVEPEVLVGALRGAGDLAASQGDHTRAAEHLERSLRMADRLGDDVGAATSLTALASLPHRAGDLREATRLFEEALERAQRGGEPSRIGHILTSLALLSEDQGRSAEAEAYAAEALGTLSATEDPYVATDVLLAQGEISINRGHASRARQVLREALRIARANGFTDVITWATAYMGKLALGEKDVEGGERLLSQSLAMFQELGIPLGTVWAMRHLAGAALEQGDIARAGPLLEEALQVSLDQVLPDAPHVLQSLAELELHREHWEKAAVLAAAAEAARTEMGLELPRAELASAQRASALLRDRLGRESMDQLTSKGTAMSLTEAARHALSDHSSSL